MSFLDQTLVVKHMNESSITKDQESFSLVNNSLEENFGRRVDANQLMMFDASKLEVTSSSFNSRPPPQEYNSAGVKAAADDIVIRDERGDLYSGSSQQEVSLLDA